MPSSGHSLLRRIQRGIGVGHRLGDENAAVRRRIELEECASGEDSRRSIGPVRIGHPRLAAPAAEAVVEILPADQPVGEVVAALAGTFSTGSTCSSIVHDVSHLRVDPGVGSAREIGVLAKPARHRLVATVAAARRTRQPALVEREMLPRLIFPWPFARLRGGSAGRRRLARVARPSTGSASPGRAAGSGRRPCSARAALRARGT